jgi:hypothetical protein
VGAEQGAVRKPMALRVSVHRASASVALGWKPRVVVLAPLPRRTRTECCSRFTSAGVRLQISETRSPDL